MLAWMLYTVAISGFAAGGALVLEPLGVARGVPRRLAWLAALLTAFAVPILVAIRPVALPDAAGALEPNPPFGASSPSVVALATGIDWDRWLLVAWVAASLVMLLALIASAFRLWRAGRQGRTIVIDGALVALTDDVGPGALSFGATRIVVPAALMSLDPSRRELLLRHEREHLQAGDPHLLLASLATLAVFPWNPALWYIVRRLRTALELDCDARVLASGGDLHAYGDLLLTVASARRHPRLAAYLAFAAAPSLLEKRIRAMTARHRTPALAVQLSLGLAALAVIVAACETRRPEPLAPVASYTIADGKATPNATPRSATNDSARSALGAEVRERVPAPTLSGNASDPLVIIYDADGNTVLTGRLGARDANGGLALDSIPYPAQAIASIDVIKSGAMLPPEARGGLIKIVLKREGTGQLKRAMPGGGDSARVQIRARPATASRHAQVTAIIRDSDGRELLRQELTSGSFDDLPVKESAIATMNVLKSTDERSEVHITLKKGEGLTARH